MRTGIGGLVAPSRDVAFELCVGRETCLLRGEANRLDIKIELDLPHQPHQGHIVLVASELVLRVRLIT